MNYLSNLFTSNKNVYNHEQEILDLAVLVTGGFIPQEVWYIIYEYIS